MATYDIFGEQYDESSDGNDVGEESLSDALLFLSEENDVLKDDIVNLSRENFYLRQALADKAFGNT